MANMTLDEILQQVSCICREHHAEHLYLFGSYATGTATPTSDIDVVVCGSKDIWALRDEVDRIPTLKKIDIFDYDRCTNPHLRKDIDCYGRKIF